MKRNQSAYAIFLLLSVGALGLAAQQPENDQKQFEEIKAKAAAGDAEAQYNLFVRYVSNSGVAKDLKEEVKWCRKAAEQNYAPAQWALGDFYLSGEGVVKDYAEAAKWFRKAAEQNYASAQIELGHLYKDGKGVPKDNVEAYKWFLLAAAQGNKITAAITDLENKMTREQIAEGQRLARTFKP